MKPVSNGRRPRGRPNRKQHGGPSRPTNFEGGGSEGRSRGNAHQAYERYLAMARDALSAGDRVVAETHYQHAEHYFRVINSSTDPQQNGQARQDRGGGDGRHDDNRQDGARPDDTRRDQADHEEAHHAGAQQDGQRMREAPNGNQPAVPAANGQDAPLQPARPDNRGGRQQRRRAPEAPAAQAAPEAESGKGNGAQSESDNADAQPSPHGDGGCEPVSV